MLPLFLLYEPRINKGLKHSPETKLKISQSQIGRCNGPLSDSARQNMCLSHQKFVYVTPFGTFNTQKEVSAALYYSSEVFLKSNIITKWAISKHPEYPKTWLGKTYEEVGFKKIEK